LLDNHRAVALPQLIPNCQHLSAEPLMQIVQYIMDNLHVDLSVSDLARRFSLEEGVLLPAFQSHTGTALDQFVLRRRIERALDLLKHSNASDTEIAMGIGWDSTPAFQDAFFSYLGVSPTEYRRSLPPKQQVTALEGSVASFKCRQDCRRASVVRFLAYQSKRLSMN